ncbi:hypothetical protein ACFLS7_02350 [Bacteroidota bacterium]
MKKPTNIFLFFSMLCITGLTVMLSVFTAHGQKPHLNYQEIDAKFSEVWNTSVALRTTYSWYSRTDVIRDGDTVNVRIEKHESDMDGRIISQVISEKQAELPSIILIRQLAEASKARLIAFMTGLKVYLEQYALTNDSLRHTFFARAAIGVPDANGLLLVAGSNIIAKEDKLNWWIDTKNYSITKATIATSYDDTKVDFTAFYDYFPTGMNYLTRAEIRVPTKNLVVKLQFYDFKQKK